MSELKPEKTVRIGKLLAQAGLTSRREAAAFLSAHEVRVNDEIVKDLNYKISDEHIPSLRLKVDGKPVVLNPVSDVLLLNKPRGVACSHRHQMIRGKQLKTVFDLLPVEYARWFFAGRLDVSSEGLVVLSNDGDHIYALSHPSQAVLKKYVVKTNRPLSPAEMQRMEKGIMDKGEKLRCEKVQPLEIPAKYEMHLREGKNREIRRLLERVGVIARQLVRTDLGPYQLGDLASGKYRLESKKNPPVLSHLTQGGKKHNKA